MEGFGGEMQGGELKLYGRGERTEEILEDRVKILSAKIRSVLESVASMRRKKYFIEENQNGLKASWKIK